MKLALIQNTLVWEDALANRRNFEAKIDSIAENVDLIILPEMFSTGFSMQPERLAESMAGETVSWLKHMANKTGSAITGSMIISENGHYFNRLLFVFPSGEIQYYNKRHLFSLAGEDKVYTAGNDRLVIEYKGFRICPLVCYDLRFPVFSRNTENYDVLLYVANWPEPRINAWDALLKARAIENMSYAVGVNRVGTDGNGHNYTGHSQAVDFLGNYELMPMEQEGVFIVQLDKEKMLQAREKFAFLEDRDEFTVNGNSRQHPSSP